MNWYIVAANQDSALVRHIGSYEQCVVTLYNVFLDNLLPYHDLYCVAGAWSI